MADKGYDFRMISVKKDEYRRFQALRNEMKTTNTQAIKFLMDEFYRSRSLSRRHDHKESEE